MNLEFEKMKGWSTKEEVENTREKNILLNQKKENDEKIKELEEKNKPLHPFSKESVDLTKQINALKDHNDDISELLTTTVVGTDEKVRDYTFVGGEIEFDLGAMNGRSNVDPTNRRRIPGSLYNNTNTAQIVLEGEEAEVKELNENITVNVTEKEEVHIFENVLGVNIATYLDDKVNIDKAFAHVHEELFVNAENQKAFEIMQSSKESIPMTVDTILEKINANLCAKAKRKATIVVNKDGFAKLDVNINGVPAVTKNENGDFVFMKKYIIREVDNEILPNKESGEIPVIIGDTSVVRFYLLSDTHLVKDDFFNYKMLDRRIRKEIITLSTHSDSSYICCTI